VEMQCNLAGLVMAVTGLTVMAMECVETMKAWRKRQ
jgi:hypothetical protein